MAAKTVFTERSCKVATDLFDGHLREFGALDLDECAKFVEVETGFKVQFVMKPGLNIWVDDNIEISSIPPLSLQLAAPTVRQFYPPHTSTFFSASTSPTLSPLLSYNQPLQLFDSFPLRTPQLSFPLAHPPLSL
jgi:hypothetical protein